MLAQQRTTDATGCPVPDRIMPNEWTYQSDVVQVLPAEDGWWKLFDDPILDSLIVMAQEQNYDILMATRRIEAARQQVRAAKAAYYPTIDLSASYTREREAGVNSNTYNVGASMSWEIDLFGRITANVSQQKAGLRVSKVDREATMVSVAAELATNYIQLRVYQAQLAVAQAHISRQDSVVGIARTRFECGLVSKIDVDQALTILYSTRADVPMLRSSIRSTINAIALLTGSYADQMYSLLAPMRELPDHHRIVAIGIPADLLRRRPDVLAAEAQVAQAAAALGVARKDYLPTLTLEGNIGYLNHGHGDIFDSNHLTYSVAPTLSWTVFSGFARAANIAAARADMERLIDNYNLTLMTAYNEADNAMVAYSNSLQRIDDYQSAQQSSAEFMHLSIELYRNGLSDFTNVANAQTSYLSYTNSEIAARGSSLLNLIQLYRALGGGF